MHVIDNKLSFEPGETSVSFQAALVLFVDYAPEEMTNELANAVCNQLYKPDALWDQALKLSMLIESTNPSFN